MADALDATVEVSLGQLAVAQGVLTTAQRDHLGVELLRRATTKRPTSMARLLVQAGLTAQQVQALLVRGAHFPAVRCDACELSIPQGQLRRREELPCPRCGSLVLGFAIYAAPPGEKSQADDESTTAGPSPEALDATERWRTVLPVPGSPPRESGATDRWPGVLPLPTDAEDVSERTITFSNVLSAPGDGTVDLPPGATAAATSDPVDSERTLAFGDVFLLPGRKGPRPEREVSEEMLTLVAPQGFTAMAASTSDPSSIVPADFDPGAVTAPMAKDEIQAMLRKGPPPQARAAKPAPPAPAPEPPLPPLPTLEPVAPTPPSAPKTSKTDRRKRPAPEPKPRRWPLVLALVVMVLVVAAGGGAYAAYRYGWFGS